MALPRARATGRRAGALHQHSAGAEEPVDQQMHVECVAEHGASRDVVGSKGDDWVGRIWRGGEGTGATGRRSAAGQTGARGGVRRAAFVGLAGILLLGAPPRPLSRMGKGHGRARGTTLQLACRCAQSATFYACTPPRLANACHFNVHCISSSRCLASF
jgi:hypothetical protein